MNVVSQAGVVEFVGHKQPIGQEPSFWFPLGHAMPAHVGPCFNNTLHPPARGTIPGAFRDVTLNGCSCGRCPPLSCCFRCTFKRNSKCFLASINLRCSSLSLIISRYKFINLEKLMHIGDPIANVGAVMSIFLKAFVLHIFLGEIPLVAEFIFNRLIQSPPSC